MSLVNKIIKLCYIIAGCGLISQIVLNIPEGFFIFIAFTSLAVVLHSQYRSVEIHKKRPLRRGSFEEKVREHLGLDGIVIHKKHKLPKYLGGFTLPAIPIFTVSNSEWKSRQKEAILHENVHNFYLINQGFLIQLLLLSFSFSMLIQYYVQNLWVTYFSIIMFTTTGFVYFEWITFRKTSQLASLFNFKSTDWSWGYARKYFVIYTIQITLSVVIIYGIQFFFKSLFFFLKVLISTMW